MNSKSLIISFVAVSVAALIVSSFAVFAVAKTYAVFLADSEDDSGIFVDAEEIIPPEMSAVSVPDASVAETNQYEVSTESEETASQTETTETMTEPEIVTSAEESPQTDAETAPPAPVGFILSLSGGKLIITSPDGEAVYERIIEISDLLAKDRDALLSGIDFPELADAMSAVYDLIS